MENSRKYEYGAESFAKREPRNTGVEEEDQEPMKQVLWLALVARFKYAFRV